MIRMILCQDWNHQITIEASDGYHIKDAYAFGQTYRPTESEKHHWMMDMSGSKNKLEVNYEKD